MITRLLKSRLFPVAPQVVAAAFLVPTLGLLLFGPPGRSNPANLVVWMFWWPLLCVLFLVAGRVWCSLCPFTFLGSLAQRLAGLQLPVPDFLKRHAGGLIAIALFLLFWLEDVMEAVDSPRGTAVVLLSILSGAVIFGLLFRGRAWCRYVCPLGGISLVYARASLLKVRASESACAECLTKDCVVPDSQYAGCPMNLTPFAIDTVSNCSFCGSCLKRCTNRSLRVSFEAPSLDLLGHSFVAPAVVWLAVLLAGLLSFQNTLKSPRLPVAAWLQGSADPALVKTLLMAGSMAFWYLLFRAAVRLAGGSAAGVERSRLLELGALPLIPLLLFNHLGYLSDNFWANAGTLRDFVAGLAGVPWLHAKTPWPGAWTRLSNPVFILLGLSTTLWVARWVLAREPGAPSRRIGWSFGLFYVVHAGWNLFTTWPAADAGPGLAVHPAAAVTAPQHGWAVLWPFLGVNAALLALVLIVRRSERQAASDAKDAEFSASRSWVIRDTSGAGQREILEWLLEQAVQAKWRIPAVVGLANATTEIVSFLQRTLSDGSAVTVNATLRKKKGVMTVFHEGRPLNLPAFKAVASLDDADDAAMDGLELRLAEAQVEQMHYQARLSDSRCCFTLRQTCCS